MSQSDKTEKKTESAKTSASKPSQETNKQNAKSTNDNAQKTENKSVKTTASTEGATANKTSVKKVKKSKAKTSTSKKAPKKKSAKSQSKKSTASKTSTTTKKTATTKTSAKTSTSNVIPLNPTQIMETIMTNNKFEQAFASFDQFGNEVKASADALVKCNTVLTKGIEEMSRAWFAYSQASFAKTTEAGKKVMSSKNMSEALEAQSQYTQEAFNDFVSEATKISEKAVKVSTEAMAPVKQKMEETADKVAKNMAA